MSVEKTKIQLSPAFKIETNPFLGIESKLFFMGSCFGEEISRRFQLLQITSKSNPYGVLFHPIALLQNLQQIAFNQASKVKDLFEYKGIYHSLSHANRFQHMESETLHSIIDECTAKAHSQFIAADMVCITLGTAWTYHHIPSKKNVGNCHKLPQKQFQKNLTPHQNVLDTILSMAETITSANPKAQILFTVSPVRHLRDGIIQNLQSKSKLISALHEASVLNPRILYFPAYEIAHEELKDWRFFKYDLMHPSEWTINHIFTRFCETLCKEAMRDELRNRALSVGGDLHSKQSL
ncbi:MAG: hypothetical protein EXR17_06130 [Flavobacteriaceae bacterium]|nr:hypothetical protein [Flavobacteriaceae bacterium]